MEFMRMVEFIYPHVAVVTMDCVPRVPGYTVVPSLRLPVPFYGVVIPRHPVVHTWPERCSAHLLPDGSSYAVTRSGFRCGCGRLFAIPAPACCHWCCPLFLIGDSL